MRKRLLTGCSIIGVVVLAFAATRLHSQADFAPWVPMHLARQIVFHQPDGSLDGTQIHQEFYQFRDGSTATKSTNTDDRAGTLEVMIAPTRHAFSIDLATGKAHTWEYRGETLVNPRRRRCGENIHPQLEKVTSVIAHVPVLGHDTAKITVEGKFGDRIFTWERYMSPSLGCMELRNDLWVDGVLKTSTIATAIEVGDQDESLLKKPASVEIVSGSEYQTQYFAARGKTR